MVMLLRNLSLEKSEWGFNNLKEHYGSKETIEKIEATTKFKGKMLLGLKEYPRLNLKKGHFGDGISIRQVKATIYSRRLLTILFCTLTSTKLHLSTEFWEL